MNCKGLQKGLIVAEISINLKIVHASYCFGKEMLRFIEKLVLMKRYIKQKRNSKYRLIRLISLPEQFACLFETKSKVITVIVYRLIGCVALTYLIVILAYSFRQIILYLFKGKLHHDI